MSILCSAHSPGELNGSDRDVGENVIAETSDCPLGHYLLSFSLPFVPSIE
jgi:hypothetical protein